MRKTIFFVLFICIYSFGLADEKGETTYSLKDCIKIAAQKNTDLEYAEASFESAESNKTSAYGNYLPSVYFSMDYSRQLNETIRRNYQGVIIETPVDEPNSYSMYAGANWVLFDGFNRESNYKRAKLGLESVKLNVEYVKSRVLRDIHLQFIEVIKKKQIVKIREENLNNGQKELEQKRAQYEAGVQDIGVVYAQEAENGVRELDLVNAENDLNLAKSTLLKLMGLNPDMEADFTENDIPTEVPDDKIKEFRLVTGSINDAIDTTLNNRTDFKLADINIQSAETSVDMAESAYYPQLSANGGWYWTNSELSHIGDLGSSSIGLSLNVPIFSNFNTDYQVEYAKLQLNQKQIEKKQLEQELRNSIKSQLLYLDAAEKQLRITEKSLKSAELNYNMAKEKYDIGEYSIIDYFNTNYLYTNAKINRINAVYNYYQVQKDMMFLMGILK